MSVTALCSSARWRPDARRLGLSEGTVRTHPENICDPLQASSRTAAVVRAFSDRVPRALLTGNGRPPGLQPAIRSGRADGTLLGSGGPQISGCLVARRVPV